MAVVGQVTHVALQGYVQMCVRSTLCSGDRHTTGIPKTARDKLGVLLCSNTAGKKVLRSVNLYVRTMVSRFCDKHVDEGATRCCI